jgi:N-acetylglucosamine kinase-like BadF-type ATPase
MSEILYFLGIDGGGTKTDAWLGSLIDGAPADAIQVIGRGSAGPSNQRSVGRDTALINLNSAIEQAFQAASLERRSVAAACFGLAGADRESDRSVIEAFATHTRVAERTQVVNDAVPLLCCGPSSSEDPFDGVALICGTGSMAYGRRANGQFARSGGWGYLFSDEGSSFGIGREALNKVMRMVDGRGPETRLLQETMKHLNLNSPSSIVAAVYGAANPREVVSGLAELAFREATLGDSVAASIIDDAAMELALLVSSVSKKLDLANSTRLALAGGVFRHQTDFCRLVCAKIEDHGIRIREHWLVETPVLGALRMAVALVRGS